jgi:hypothetical protein
MSYAVQSPVAATAAPRRPLPVLLSAGLLSLMGLVGLGYAVATLVVAPGVVDRFRDAAAGADSTDVDGLITVLWIGAALGTVLAVILFALYLVLALGLRRGSNASRIGTWVVCGLGAVAGGGSALAVLAQRSGEGTPGSLGVQLSEAYPGSWIGLNVALAVAQIVGYLIVAVLLLASPGSFFGRTAKTQPDQYAQPAPPPGFGQPAYGPPPGYGPPAYGPTGYAPPPGYVSPNPYGGPAAYPAAPSAPPTAPPQPGPDDEYWSRPSS